MMLVAHPKLRRRRLWSWSPLAALVAVPVIAACSASDDGTPGARVGADPNEGPGFFDPPGAGGGGAMTNGQNGPDGLVEPNPDGNGQIDVDDACVVDQAQAELVEQPVDIILLLDNSGSMKEELRAVEENLNVNFASILLESAVDYRVILISRHRDGPRSPLPPPGEEIEETAEDTSVCVTQPLSGLAACDTASQPVFSDRFFQFNTKVESDDSFDIALDTYAQPIDSDYQEDDEDDMPLAPLGWSAWLRPGAKKVFLELTDDNEDMTSSTFIQQLQAMSPSDFGTDPQNPSFIFHSIVGLAEKASAPTDPYLASEPIQPELCTGNEGDVTSAGTTYQELSILTGGLRFPICQYDGYDAVFRTIAEDVVLTSNIACDFPIPQPPAGLELDLEKVAIQYNPGDGSEPVQFGQAPAFGVCQSNAFYIANGRATLCPDACSAIRRDPRAAVSVLFTCESTIIIQ